MITIPHVESGLYIISSRIHRSDMFGNVGEEIHVTNAKITSDIDRPGAKSRIELEGIDVSRMPEKVIGPGRWVTVFQDIYRENKPVQTIRRGTFELGQPSLSILNQRVHAVNSGNDIVDLLTRAGVLDTFYTPVRGFVREDAILAIRMLGITSMGPNLVGNNGFEDGLTGWTNESTAAGDNASQASMLNGWPAPEGVNIARITINGGALSSQYRSLRNSLTIPSSVSRVFVSGWVYQFATPGTEAAITLRVNGTPSGTAYLGTGYQVLRNGYNRIFFVADMPESWTTSDIGVLVKTRDEYSPLPSNQTMHFDDIRVHAVTGNLLPEDMVVLPESSLSATSRIQHVPGQDLLLAAVNDRLASIGIMAVNATPDSRFTSRQSRDIGSDASVRTYTLGSDARIVGELKTGRSTTSMYNRVVVTHEDFVNGTSSWAMAENTDIDDPWSVHNTLLEPKFISIQEAVSQQVLQERADAEILRASIQETIQFALVPDELTVYDFIDIVGPEGHPAAGKWAIENIEIGLMTRNPLMIVSARRSVR